MKLPRIRQPHRQQRAPRPRPGPVPAGTLAARTVTGVVAGMVVVTAAATVVGFWLSYGGLHQFAVRSGLAGAEAWAWPASVDLFIAAGEAGVTISALRRERDHGAWVYLVLGLVASVSGNTLHVDPGHLSWAPYAVAAVPPMSAMLALAALLRQAYRIAAGRSTQDQPAAEQPPAAPAAVPVPGLRQLQRELRLGAPKAREVQRLIRASANGHGQAQEVNT